MAISRQWCWKSNQKLRQKIKTDTADILNNLVDETEQLRVEWKAIAVKAQRQTPVGQPAQQADTPVADRGEFQPAIY